MCLIFYLFVCFYYNFISFQNLFFWCDTSLGSTEIISATLKLQTFSKGTKTLWPLRNAERDTDYFEHSTTWSCHSKGTNQRIFSLKSCYVEGCVKMIYAKNPIGIKKACILKEKMTTLLIASPLWHLIVNWFFYMSEYSHIWEICLSYTCLDYENKFIFRRLFPFSGELHYTNNSCDY